MAKKSPLNTPNKLQAAMDKLLLDSLGKLNVDIAKTQNGMWIRVSTLINGLDLDSNGNIKKTNKNINLLNRIQRELRKAIVTDAYKGRIKSFNTTYGKSGALSNEYFTSIVDNFKTNQALFDAIKNDYVNLTIESLAGAGLNTAVIDPVRVILQQNITTGASIVDLQDQLRQLIKGIPGERLGSLERHTGQIATDAVFQYSRQYQFAVADDLGLEWYFYSRGTVADTRKFCLERNGKYWHRKEVELWGSVPATWQGRIPSTNSSNIFFFLGGFRCMHNLTPVSDVVVPKEDKDRAKRKGLILI